MVNLDYLPQPKRPPASLQGAFRFRLGDAYSIPMTTGCTWCQPSHIIFSAT